MAAMEAFQSKATEGGYEEEKTAAEDTLAENDGPQELKPQERELQNKELQDQEPQDQEEPGMPAMPPVSLREEVAEAPRNNRQADCSFALWCASSKAILFEGLNRTKRHRKGELAVSLPD